VRRTAGEQPLQVDLPALRILHELRRLLLSGGTQRPSSKRSEVFMHPSRSFPSTFLSGALCGIAAVWIADELRRRRRRPGPRLVVRNNAADRKRGQDATEQAGLTRDEAADDPAS
jgi:hypothetical protein